MKIPTWVDQYELYTSTSGACGAATCAAHHEDAKKQKRRTASVRFAAESDNVVHDILPLTEYTPEEVRSCWFNRVEYNAFKRSSLVTLNLNREGRLLADDPDRTMRGLECRTRECTDSRREMRENAMAAVLNEQREQHRLGNRDPQAIADLYHSVSWKSQYTAYTQGLADEQDAREVSFEDSLFVARSASPSKRNTVLSKVISIDSNEPNPAEEEETPTIAGLDLDFWASSATTTTEKTAFNLNSFFNDLSLGIAVGAA